MSKQNANPTIKSKATSSNFDPTLPSSFIDFFSSSSTSPASSALNRSSSSSNEDDLASQTMSLEYALSSTHSLYPPSQLNAHDPLCLLYPPTSYDDPTPLAQANNPDFKFSHSLLKPPDEDESYSQAEIFNIIRGINDPEHPLSLEDLSVVTKSQITILPSSNNDDTTNVTIRFTPTIPHCSMATLIGLCLKVKTSRSLPSNVNVQVRIKEGTHASEIAVNKQLADKERVGAALENSHLRGVVEKCVLGIE